MSTLHFNQPVRIDSAITHGVARIRISHTDLTDAATSQSFVWNDLAIGSGESLMPANARVMFAFVNLIEEFAGGGATSAIVGLGDVGSATELINAVDIFTGAGEGIKAGNGLYTLGTFEAAYAPIVTVGSDVNVGDLVSGVLEVNIAYQAINTDSLTS